MAWIVAKILITALVVVAISELAKRSDKLGAVMAALPVATVLAMCWMRIEGQEMAKIANHARLTFWYVLPTLPMFLAFPSLLSRFGFMGAMAASLLLCAACFALAMVLARLFGVDLM